MMNAALYNACKKKGMQPKHVAEVGVYFPETSNVLGFIQDGVRSDLFEADPDCVVKIRDYFKQAENVRLFPYAVVDQPGPVTFYHRGASTFAE
ncbi:MAG TPA: hypothetical protein VFM15_05040, partial [Gammaproteobacteria bacterium]|nr:hypothetical protein [Gammaproteobacteria bacterium]